VNPESRQNSVIDLATNAVLATIPLGSPGEAQGEIFRAP